jgi:hypothetical protein
MWLDPHEPTFAFYSPSTASPYIASSHAEAEASKPCRRLSGLLDLPREDGAESLHAQEWRCCVQSLRNEESDWNKL